ncbi:NUDIX domain-containing protein [Nakamurella leprariae]|uniref:NUDIX domain-containing protein n=1 Tax=Nakamurella leprariae TaxID=2803911 RepID=A0A938YIL2_9ACTN|nr:NUDIX domain-containing protein [Nakamurella leprariae]MBM9468455.1 NUDIX domain-containing protein [Nakamurella leprariae]
MSPARPASAGILLFRSGPDGPEVLLGHMGGPLWAKRDERAWTIPKGEPLPGESLLDTARREFAEELGSPPPDGEPIELGQVRQSGGKVVTAFALAGDFDPDTLRSNTFEMVWPPRSGRVLQFPELDRVAWFGVPTAAAKVVTAQQELLERLVSRLRAA